MSNTCLKKTQKRNATISPGALNEDEKEKLILEHMTFARNLAIKFFRSKQTHYFDLDDFISSAYFGLCEAAKNYDPSFANTFQTFCYVRINGALHDLVRRNKSLSYKVKKIAGGQKESIHFIDEILDTQGIKLHRYQLFEKHQLSYQNQNLPEKYLEQKERKAQLTKLLEQLPQAERDIIYYRYCLGQTYGELSNTLKGISKSWLCRLHARALKSLNQIIENEKIKESL